MNKLIQFKKSPYPLIACALTLIGITSHTPAVLAQTQSPPFLNEMNTQSRDYRESCAMKSDQSRNADWRLTLDARIQTLIHDPARIDQFNVEFETLSAHLVEDDSSTLQSTQAFTRSMVERLNSQEFAERVRTVARKKSCIQGIHFHFYPENGFHATAFSIAGSRDQALTGTLQKAKDHEQEPSSSVSICSPPIHMKSNLRSVPSRSTIDLQSDYFFAGNSAQLDPEQARSLKQMIQTALTPTHDGCIKKIRSVQIETSSDATRNTANFAPWDFIGLSTARAAFLQSILEPQLAELESRKRLLESAFVKIEVNPYGANGDGTSGACPYFSKIVNHQTVIEPITAETFSTALAQGATGDSLTYAQFKTGLDQARYARITFETVEEGPQCEIGDTFLTDEDYFATKCFAAEVECQ
jgi:hypothetical protein